MVILGTYSFAEEVADLAREADVEVVGFVENWDRERCGRPFLGLPVTWIDDAAALAAEHDAVCAIGSTQRRGFVDQAAAIGFRFGRLRHPSALVSDTSSLGEGCVVSAAVVVAASTEIGRHVILNRGAMVGHHTSIGDYVTVSPGANVAGKVTIGEGAYVAMGAIVLDGMTVGPGAVVAAGAVVTRDVPPGVQVQGVPARVVKEGVDGR